MAASDGRLEEAMVGWIASPERIVKQAEALLWSQVWEEIVVGLAVVSGRCVVEVLKTGVIMPKTRYSLVCTAFQEQADQVLGPFELPSLVEAETVLLAWQRVRSLVNGEGLSVLEIGMSYRRQVEQCAKAQFEREVPLCGSQVEWYTPLYAQIYPLCATRYYCPPGKDQAWFAAVVRGFCSAEMNLSACACCGEGRHLSGVYRVGDGVKTVETEVGLRLDEDGVELLEGVEKSEASSSREHELVCLDKQEEEFKGSPVRRSRFWRAIMHAGSPGPGVTVEKESRGVSNLKEEARQRSGFTEDEWEAYESAVVLEACKQIEQEREARACKLSRCERMSIIFLDAFLTHSLDLVGAREGTRTVDATLMVLLDGYEWLHRGGSIQPGVWERNRTPAGDSRPRPFAIRQETWERLVAIDQALAAQGMEKVVERVLDIYEWLIQGGLSKELGKCVAPNAAGTCLNVAPQLRECLEALGEEESTSSDETLVTLLWTYDWFYRSGLCEQVKALANTALSCFELDEDDQKKIKNMIEREEPEDRFRFIQNLYLEHARASERLGKNVRVGELVSNVPCCDPSSSNDVGRR